MEQDRPVLAVRDLDVNLAGRTVLEGVSLDVRAREIVGLIGPNGAGKTTLLRAILGLVRPRSGTVDIPVVGDERRSTVVGYVPQRHSFDWHFPVSVIEAVMTGQVAAIGWLRPAGRERKAAAEEALERVGMADLRRRPIAELSGGQRQRVLVARALTLRPRLLLLDEPFTGLDVPSQEVLTALFRQLSDDGKTLLMTTHDLSAATTLCTRFCLINGTIIADGPPEALRDPVVWLRAFGVAESDRIASLLGQGG